MVVLCGGICNGDGNGDGSGDGSGNSDSDSGVPGMLPGLRDDGVMLDSVAERVGEMVKLSADAKRKRPCALRRR